MAYSDSELPGLEHTSSNFVLHLPLGKSADTFNLETAVCSHGLFMMAPNKWDPVSKSLLRPLRLSLTDNEEDSESVLVRVSQPSNSIPLSLLLQVYDTLSLTPLQLEAIVAQVRRMLRLSGGEESKIKGFQKMHDEAKKRGFGRVFRSPTLFEDMVKCILLCNCQWPRTLSMAEALCELQLELQQPANSASTNTKTVKAEHFTPRTPAANETKKRRKLNGTPKVLFREKADSIHVLESDMQPKSLIDKHNQYQLSKGQTPDCISTYSNVRNLESDMSLDVKYEEVRKRSCSKFGNFPSPREIARLNEKYLADRCKLGYRASRILRLARDVVEGKIQLRLLEELCSGASSSNRGEVEEKLKEIYGFGPFTRGNVLMCMGFYDLIPADSETIRHLKQIHTKTTTVQTVQVAVDEIFRKFEPFQFLAYWLEVWNFYEEWFGKASEMPTSDYKLITASNMRVEGKSTRSTGKRRGSRLEDETS